MKTLTGTRQWNHPVLQTCQLVLSLSFFLLATAGTGYAQGTTGDAMGGGGSPAKPITFTKLMLHAQGRYDIWLVPEEYSSVIINYLQHQGFSVHHSKSALFNQNAPPSTRFMLGGIVDELTCPPIQGGSRDDIHCNIAITWELFDRTPNTVVYKVKTRSFAQASRRRDPPAQTVSKLILGALESLMSRERFFFAINDNGSDAANTAQYPFIDTEDLSWQEQYERQNQIKMAERQQAVEAWQAQQRQWEADTLPLRNKRKPYKTLGTALSIIGGILIGTGGILEVLAYNNHKQVETYREQWMETTDPNEWEQLKQDIVNTEDKRDLQHAFGIGTLSVGTVSLIAGIVVLAIMPELPPRPLHPRYAKSPFQLRLVIGATDLGLQLTF